jgi:hypothetical protein
MTRREQWPIQRIRAIWTRGASCLSCLIGWILFMPDVTVGQWLHGDADARRKIEEAIDRMPKMPN